MSDGYFQNGHDIFSFSLTPLVSLDAQAVCALNYFGKCAVCAEFLHDFK